MIMFMWPNGRRSQGSREVWALTEAVAYVTHRHTDICKFKTGDVAACRNMHHVYLHFHGNSPNPQQLPLFLRIRLLHCGNDSKRHQVQQPAARRLYANLTLALQESATKRSESEAERATHSKKVSLSLADLHTHKRGGEQSDTKELSILSNNPKPKSSR